MLNIRQVCEYEKTNKFDEVAVPAAFLRIVHVREKSMQKEMVNL
jgi:hypothetical protein